MLSHEQKSREDMIRLLEDSSPEERVALIQERYRKNREFIAEHYPEVDRVMESVNCPYGINLTEEFLEIVHADTGESAHIEGELARFSRELGSCTNGAWVDLFNLKTTAPPEGTVHYEIMREMYNTLDNGLPDYRHRYANGHLNLKNMADGRKLSPPVVFLGIFHGLHIDYFLKHNELDKIMLIEPDPQRFEVSCYFLDYRSICGRFTNPAIVVSGGPAQAVLNDFFLTTEVTSHMWARILPAYADPSSAAYISGLQSAQLNMSRMIFDIDQDLAGFDHGCRKVENGENILSQRVSLSAGSRIAIVASGPSLDGDIEWLRKNSDRLIIIAVHSAVKALAARGIKPDFQLSFETSLGEGLVTDLELIKDVPLISYFKINPVFEGKIDNILYVAENSQANPYDFHCKLANVMPSSTNMAFGIGLWFKAEKIYLLGCDFAFKDKNNTHASGTYNRASNNAAGSEGASRYLKVAGNFNRKENLLTNTFLDQTRLSMEKAISAKDYDCLVTNLSDGAFVMGTETANSATLTIAEYHEKQNDIRTMLAAFQPAGFGRNVTRFQSNLESIFQIFSKSVIESFEDGRLNWADFTSRLDQAVPSALSKSRNENNDLRARMFSRLFVDLLSIWYMYAVFYDSDSELERINVMALDTIRNCLLRIKLPAC